MSKEVDETMLQTCKTLDEVVHLYGVASARGLERRARPWWTDAKGLGMLGVFAVYWGAALLAEILLQTGAGAVDARPYGIGLVAALPVLVWRVLWADGLQARLRARALRRLPQNERRAMAALQAWDALREANAARARAQHALTEAQA